jgi:hypothetical protein
MDAMAATLMSEKNMPSVAAVVPVRRVTWTNPIPSLERPAQVTSGSEARRRFKTVSQKVVGHTRLNRLKVLCTTSRQLARFHQCSVGQRACFQRLEVGTTIALPHDESCCKKGQMLKIQRSSNGPVVFKLSGRMEAENVAELKILFKSEGEGRGIALDLKDLTLVDREAVLFLASCEADSVRLKNCPAYIREWINRQGNGR